MNEKVRIQGDIFFGFFGFSGLKHWSHIDWLVNYMMPFFLQIFESVSCITYNTNLRVAPSYYASLHYVCWVGNVSWIVLFWSRYSHNTFASVKMVVHHLSSTLKLSIKFPLLNYSNLLVSAWPEFKNIVLSVSSQNIVQISCGSVFFKWDKTDVTLWNHQLN